MNDNQEKITNLPKPPSPPVAPEFEIERVEGQGRVAPEDQSPESFVDEHGNVYRKVSSVNDARSDNPSQVHSGVYYGPDSYPGEDFSPRTRIQYSNEPSVIMTTRELEPEDREISPELKQKHDESVKKYPFLNLSEGEFVILEIKRHPIGLWIPIGMGVFVVICLMSMAMIYPMWLSNQSMNAVEVSAFPPAGLVILVTFLLSGLVGLFTYLIVWVYLRNQFFLTNESVIQEIQNGVFARHEQTVSLGSVEDVSFVRNGVLQTMFDFGSIRLSTEGEETTYRFHYVQNPKQQTAILTNAVEAFKNGRPVKDIDQT